MSTKSSSNMLIMSCLLALAPCIVACDAPEGPQQPVIDGGGDAQFGEGPDVDASVDESFAEPEPDCQAPKGFEQLFSRFDAQSPVRLCNTHFDWIFNGVRWMSSDMPGENTTIGNDLTYESQVILVEVKLNRAGAVVIEQDALMDPSRDDDDPTNDFEPVPDAIVFARQKSEAIARGNRLFSLEVAPHQELAQDPPLPDTEVVLSLNGPTDGWSGNSAAICSLSGNRPVGQVDIRLAIVKAGAEAIAYVHCTTHNGTEFSELRVGGWEQVDALTVNTMTANALPDQAYTGQFQRPCEGPVVQNCGLPPEEAQAQVDRRSGEPDSIYEISLGFAR